MAGDLYMVTVHRKLTVHQVQGEDSPGVCRGARAEHMPHLCVLLENEGGYRQIIWAHIPKKDARRITNYSVFQIMGQKDGQTVSNTSNSYLDFVADR